MTHINPDKAVGGPQPDEMRLLHIYSQPCEHFEARIVGNDSGLRVLRDAIIKALREGQASSGELFASDGEGYQVEVTLMPDDWHDPKWDDPKYYPHYCDRGYADDVDRIAERVINKAIARLKEVNNDYGNKRS